MTDYPMSREQESIWLNDQLDEGASRYTESWCHRLRGKVDLDVVSATLNAIVARYEPLRSALALADGQPRQMVHPPMPVPMRRRSITESELDRVLTEEMAEPMPLADPPHMRASMLELASDDVVLIVVSHHAVFDASCIRLMDEEFSEFYRAHVENRRPRLAPLPLRFGDWAARQRAVDEDPDGRHAAYWRENMRGAPAESTFPLDRARPRVLGHHGAQVELTVDADRVVSLRRLSKDLRVTPFATLAAALNVLVSKLSGQHDVVVGTPISRRQGPELREMIACLSDVMPLRQYVDPVDSFAECVTGTKTAIKAARAHRALSSTRLVSLLANGRDRSRFPLFQVVLNFDDSDLAGLSIPGLDTERIYPCRGAAKFDVFFHLISESGRIRGLVEYSTHLFTEATARLLTQRFTTLLARLIDAPDTPLGELDVMSDKEREDIRHWGAGPQPGAWLTMPGAVLDTAARTPDNVAVVQGDQRLTYAELVCSARQLAEGLAERGHTGKPVGICLDRTVEMTVAVLGVMLAGSACVPLDPAYPAERLEFMRADSDASVVLSGKNIHAPFGDGAEVWHMEDFPPAWAPARLPVVDREAPAYVIYTSGSTGRPKGVVVPHRTLANLTAWQRGRSAGGTTLQFAPLSFDVAFQELCSTWACGDTLVLVGDEERRDPQRLCDVINRHSVRRLFLPVVALQQLADHVSTCSPHLPSLAEVFSAGEQLFITPAVREFFAAHPRCFLENQYGPSETHVVTAHRLTGPPHTWPDRPSIGEPLTGAQVHILDDKLRPVPVGVLGELCIAGASLALGYHGRPELTAARFVDNPSGAGWLYRSGDLGRFTPEGTIEFAGRADDQVKIRGFRLELGEVESAVKARPGIADAAIVVSGEESVDKRLLAYYIPNNEAVDPTALRVSLREWLPDHLVPARCVRVDSFPMTSSGKIDRAALAARETAPVAAIEPVPPRTPLETRMSALWSHVLGATPGSVHDDFFVLGGDSLAAARLLVKVRQEWGVHVRLDAMFAAPTIAGFADVIERRGAVERTGLDVPTTIQLPADITPRPTVEAVVEHPQAVFLTGATGFLGVFLLRDLLANTEATVYCLVRAADTETAYDRLRRQLARHGLWNEEHAHRIIALPGDLAAPRLGLSHDLFDFLAKAADVIYHAGAQVNLVSSYARLEAANVGGTSEILRLAAAQRTVAVHHVSTAGVYAGPPGRVHPQDPIGPPSALNTGYTQSKCMAEELVGLARTRGLPVSVYRLTRLSGDTVGASGPDDDYLWLLLKGCIQAGAVPRDFPATFDLVPVDHVSGAILTLSTEARTVGDVWHVSSGNLLHFGDAVEILHEFGYALPDVALGKWISIIEAAPENVAYPLLSTMSAAAVPRPSASETVFDPVHTAKVLASRDVPSSRVDKTLFNRYLNSYVSRGFLVSP